MAIPQDVVEQVLATAKIEEVIGEFVTLKKRGKDYVGLCPFHSEKTPSFYVSPTKGIFKCFGCGRGGSVISFLKEHEKMTFPEAVRYLADKYGIEIPEEISSEEAAEEERFRSGLFSVMEYAVQHYRKMLGEAAGRAARAYLRDRGITDDLIDHFGLGWAEGNARLGEHLARIGVDPKIIEAAGLARRKGGRWNDLFWDRLMFPIRSPSGRPIALAGRLLADRPNAPKYLNSPDTPIFRKSSVLYGLSHARDGIRKNGFAVVVEGYFDVIAVHRCGTANAVAPMGTALTPDQLKRLRRFTDRVVFVMDGDRAGREAALKGFALAAAHDFTIEAVMLPPGEDPDSLVRKSGPDALRELIEQRVHFLDFILAGEPLDDPDAKAAVVQRAVAVVAAFSDPIRQAAYLEKLADAANIPLKALTGHLNRLRTQRHRRPRPVPAANESEGALSAAPVDATAIEHAVLRVVLEHGVEPLADGEPVIQRVYQEVADAQWRHPELKALLDWLMGYYVEHGAMPPPPVVISHADPALHQWLAEGWVPLRPSQKWHDQPGHSLMEVPLDERVEKVLAFFRIYQLTSEGMELQARIRAEASASEREALFEQWHRIREEIQRISAHYGLAINPFATIKGSVQ